MKMTCSRSCAAFAAAASLSMVAACGGAVRASGGCDPGGSDAMAPQAQPSPVSVRQGFVSIFPSAEVVAVPVPGTPPSFSLQLRSLNMVRGPAAQGPQEWLGEVENVGTTPACEVFVGVVIEDAGGQGAAVVDGASVESPPYHSAESVDRSLPCLGPGDFGDFDAVGVSPWTADIRDVATISLRFGTRYGGSVYVLVPDPYAPLVVSSAVAAGGGDAVAGTLTERQNATYVDVAVYARDPSGLVLGRLSARDPELLRRGQTASFTTGALPRAFSDYRLFSSMKYDTTPGN
jgi:hypothetical protein